MSIFIRYIVLYFSVITLPGFGVRRILTSWNELVKLHNHFLELVSIICFSWNVSILSKLSNLLMYSYVQYSFMNHSISVRLVVMSYHLIFHHLNFLSRSLCLFLFFFFFFCGQVSQKFDSVVDLFKKLFFFIFYLLYYFYILYFIYFTSNVYYCFLSSWLDLACSFLLNFFFLSFYFILKYIEDWASQMAEW